MLNFDELEREELEDLLTCCYMDLKTVITKHKAKEALDFRDIENILATIYDLEA